MMSSVGIVCAKKNSSRFPNKNIQDLNGIPLFWYSVLPLVKSSLVDDVYVATDSKDIRTYCENRNVKVIHRGVNANHNDESLLGVLRYAYKCISKSYDNIVTIMANCPRHTQQSVDSAISLLENKNLFEVRSFNSLGEESGLLVFREKVILESSEISSYMGFVMSEVKEIHTKEELDETKDRLQHKINSDRKEQK